MTSAGINWEIIACWRREQMLAIAAAWFSERWHSRYSQWPASFRLSSMGTVAAYTKHKISEAIKC